MVLASTCRCWTATATSRSSSSRRSSLFDTALVALLIRVFLSSAARNRATCSSAGAPIWGEVLARAGARAGRAHRRHRHRARPARRGAVAAHRRGKPARGVHADAARRRHLPRRRRAGGRRARRAAARVHPAPVRAAASAASALVGPAALVVFTLFFGALHFDQGFDVAIAVGSLGLLWGVLYIKRRSAVMPMVNHAGFNAAQVAQHHDRAHARDVTRPPAASGSLILLAGVSAHAAGRHDPDLRVRRNPVSSPGCGPGRSIATSTSRTSTATSTTPARRATRLSTRRFSSGRTKPAAASTSRRSAPPCSGRRSTPSATSPRCVTGAPRRRAQRAVHRGGRLRVGRLRLARGLLSARDRRGASSAAGVGAAVAIWIGTPLVFYMYVAPPFSHACSAFAVALFLDVWLRVRDSWTPAGAALLGADRRADGDGARTGPVLRRRAGVDFGGRLPPPGPRAKARAHAGRGDDAPRPRRPSLRPRARCRSCWPMRRSCSPTTRSTAIPARPSSSSAR